MDIIKTFFKLIAVIAIAAALGEALSEYHAAEVNAEPKELKAAQSSSEQRVKSVAEVLSIVEQLRPDEAAQDMPEAKPRCRDDIISHGNLLSYELQETMQDICSRYGVPYALALAIADTESHFTPDIVSATNDHGLMQINAVNHAWLAERGIDVTIPAGNIEAGVYMIAQLLDKYDAMPLALMAYNCGEGGAKRLWSQGVYETSYSRKVMTAYEYWENLLEE